jgi:hypothetical protein
LENVVRLVKRRKIGRESFSGERGRIITNHIIPPRNDFRRDLIRKPRHTPFVPPRKNSIL